jgi:hypothetical protein
LHQTSESAARPAPLSVAVSAGPASSRTAVPRTASLPTANGTPLVLPRGVTSIKMMARIGRGLTRDPGR